MNFASKSRVKRPYVKYVEGKEGEFLKEPRNILGIY